MRPTIQQLAAARRLCGEEPRFCSAFEWEGQCVKLYRIADERRVTVDALISDILEGERRLRAAGIPVCPILDVWQEGTAWLLAQPLCQKVDEWERRLDEGRSLAIRAFSAGVADTIPSNIMWLDGSLVVVDTDEILEEGDPDAEWLWDQLDERWQG